MEDSSRAGLWADNQPRKAGTTGSRSWVRCDSRPAITLPTSACSYSGAVLAMGEEAPANGERERPQDSGSDFCTV